jgi:hypothetical protein
MGYPSKSDPAFWLMVERYYPRFEGPVVDFIDRYYSDDASYLQVATRYNECIRELAAEMLEQIVPLDTAEMPKSLKEWAAWREECRMQKEANRDAYIAQFERMLAEKKGGD